MELMTVRDLVSNIVDTWVANYPEPQTFHDGQTSTAILAKLKALDLQTCGPKDIEAIIGNQSWTTLRCHCCGKTVPALVLLEGGHEDEHSAMVCQTCLIQALDLFREEVPQDKPENPIYVLAQFIEDHNRSNRHPKWTFPDLPEGHTLLPLWAPRPKNYLVFDLDSPGDGWLPGPESGALHRYIPSTLQTAGIVLACPVRTEVPSDVPAPAQTRPAPTRKAAKPLAGRNRASASQT